jgi:hypothetical protein
MGSMIAMLALYQAFVLPSFALSTFLVGYLILRFRDREDTELGLKSLFSYLQTLTMQIVLSCLALILTSMLTEMMGSDSKGWRALLGVALVNGGAWVLFGKLLEKTNVADRPAARKLFEGFGMATTLLIALISVSLFAAAILSNDDWQTIKAALAFSGVYGGTSFLLLKKMGVV